MIIIMGAGRKNVSTKSRHIRWNWESSPDSIELVRYHFVIVDDKNRKGILNKVLEEFQKVSSGIEIIREREGKVAESKFRYLFSSFDTILSPNILNFNKLNKQIKRDYDLYERQKGNIEDYVAEIYE